MLKYVVWFLALCTLHVEHHSCLVFTLGIGTVILCVERGHKIEWHSHMHTQRVMRGVFMHATWDVRGWQEQWPSNVFGMRYKRGPGGMAHVVDGGGGLQNSVRTGIIFTCLYYYELSTMYCTFFNGKTCVILWHNDRCEGVHQTLG